MSPIPVPGSVSRILLALLLLAASGAALARTKLVDTWQNENAPPSEPERIALIAVLPDALVRQTVERDMVALLRKRGWNVIEGSSLKGLGGGIRGKIDTEKATAALRAGDADAVIVMFYSGGGVTGSYERSDYWARYEGSGMGWGYYNWGQPYFVDVYSIQKGPGYADTMRSAWVETSFFDLDTGEPMWRIVTETRDIEHSDAVKGIAKHITTRMRKSGY